MDQGQDVGELAKPLDESELRRIRVQCEDRSPENTVRRLLATLDDRNLRVVAFLRGWEDGPGFGYPDGMCDVLQTVAGQIERGDHLRGTLVLSGPGPSVPVRGEP